MSATTPERLRWALVPILVAACLAVVVSCGSSPSSPQSSAPSTRVVTDMSGATVTVPVDVKHVAEQFPAHTITAIMLGAGSKITAISTNVKTIPFLAKVYPRISSIPEQFQYSDASGNVEQLLQEKIDVVFGYSASTLRPFKNAGIASVNANWTTFPELAKSVSLSGEVLGGTAPQRAKAYVDYLNKNLNLVQSRLANLPESARPSVVHIASFPPLAIDGGGSAANLWITTAGGTNAVQDVEGSYITISAEELLKRNPDVLIIQAPSGNQGALAAGSAQSVLLALSKLPVWNDLKAVQNHRVYFNPQGMYPWERSTPEEALQVVWAAKTLHPDLFADIDIQAATRRFYQEFFNYTLTDADLNQIFQTNP